MELEIRRLTPELLEDYLYFFENEAFTDHKEWAGCYCMFFHFKSDFEKIPPKTIRDCAIKYIQDGRLRGYLAYNGGRVVGWCNTDVKTAFASLMHREELWDNSELDKKIKSVVCFLVVPDMRGKGIASQLLKRICADAASDGYDCIESYPPVVASDMYIAYHGTKHFFEKHGFNVYKTLKNDMIMRKTCKY